MVGETGLRIRYAGNADVPAIAAIYNYYIEHTTATFEEQALEPVQIAGRMQVVGEAGLPWLVAAQDKALVGYAYATPWRERAAYRHSVEISAYVHPERVRSGAGTALYQRLIDELGRRRLHSLIGVVTLPNPASAAFHGKMGFRQVAHLEQVGFKFGAWLDVGYWQRLAYNRKF